MRLAFAFLFTSSVLVACEVADIPGTGGAPSAIEAAEACSVEKYDVSSMSACSCGRAHCFEKAKIPQKYSSHLKEFSSHLEDCDGDRGVCVPDTFLAGNLPTECKTDGMPGRCLDVCVRTVAKLEGSLTRGDGDLCAEAERCVPCVNPSTGQSTGVCTTCDGAGGADVDGGGTSCPFTGKPMDVTRYSVCKVGGRCVKESVIDTVAPEAKSRLARCDDGLCVPEEMLAEYGQHLPASCTSIAGIEGRCISTVLPEVETNKDILPKDKCRETERCIPCYSATGADTGACSTVKCDAPKTPPPKFTECCELDGAMRGKCLPRKDIPQSVQSRLEAHECPSADLCVPNENVDPRMKPATCASATGGKGICVSECVAVNTVESILLTRGSCREAQKCVPCSAAAGLPGCE